MFRKVVNHSSNHTASHPRKHGSLATLLRHPQISQVYVRQRTRGNVQPNYWRKAKARPTCHFDRQNFCLCFSSLANQRIYYPTTQLSITLQLYDSHHHLPIRLSNPTTTLPVKCPYFSRSTGCRNVARRQIPFWCLQSSLPGQAVPKVTLLMVIYDRRSGVWRLSYEVCQVHTNKSTYMLLNHHSINNKCNCTRPQMGR